MKVSTDSLFVTHIFDGEEVVCGGEEGQNWVATFYNPIQANQFIAEMQKRYQTIEAADDDRQFVSKRLVTAEEIEEWRAEGIREGIL